MQTPVNTNNSNIEVLESTERSNRILEEGSRKRAFYLIPPRDITSELAKELKINGSLAKDYLEAEREMRATSIMFESSDEKDLDFLASFCHVIWMKSNESERFIEPDFFVSYDGLLDEIKETHRKVANSIITFVEEARTKEQAEKALIVGVGRSLVNDGSSQDEPHNLFETISETLINLGEVSGTPSEEVDSLLESLRGKSDKEIMEQAILMAEKAIKVKSNRIKKGSLMLDSVQEGMGMGM